MSTAIQKRSRGVSTKRPSRSSAAANATEWTRMSSPPPNASPTSEKTRAMSSSDRTSHSVTSGLDDRLGEVADVLLDPLSLVREGDLRALVGEPLRDRPRDRALVRDARARAPASRRTSRPRGDPNRIAWRGDGRRARCGDHRGLVGDRRGDCARARATRLALRPPCPPRGSSSSESRGRSAVSGRPATSPTARRSTRSRRECSRGIPRSRCSSTTPACPRVEASWTSIPS